MYAMIGTEPDFALVMSMCSKNQAKPKEIHWTAAKAILKYFRRTTNNYLVYRGNEAFFIDGTHRRGSKQTKTILDFN